jgi:hypothetical protein
VYLSIKSVLLQTPIRLDGQIQVEITRILNHLLAVH